MSGSLIEPLHTPVWTMIHSLRFINVFWASHLEVFEVSYQQSSIIDEIDSLGRTALHLSACRLDCEAIALLLESGAESGLMDSTCRTPLHISVALGSVACTKALATGGANLQARDKFGNSPLHNACKPGHLQVVKILLAHGADINENNYAGGTPVIHANIGGHFPVIQLLVRQGADLIHGDNLGNTVVHDAVWFNVHEPLKAHLESGLRVDQKLPNGKSIVHLLVEEGEWTTMQIFLDSAQNGLERLNVDNTDDGGRTAMDCLERRRDVAEISELFQLVLQSILVATSHCAEEDGQNEIFWDAVEKQ